MTPREVRNGPVAEALLLLPAKMTSPQAELMLLAIGLQESELKHRRQHGNGPARSLWQAEQGGGMVTGLLGFHNQDVQDLARGAWMNRSRFAASWPRPKRSRYSAARSSASVKHLKIKCALGISTSSGRSKPTPYLMVKQSLAQEIQSK